MKNVKCNDDRTTYSTDTFGKRRPLMASDNVITPIKKKLIINGITVSFIKLFITELNTEPKKKNIVP